MSFLGFDTSDPAGLQKAIVALKPVLDEIAERGNGIVSSNLDRLDGATITIPAITITIKLNPIPKAQPVQQ